jgi:hypothetical protein
MTRFVRHVSSALFVLMVASTTASAGTSPGGGEGTDPRAARPRSEVPLEARMRPSAPATSTRRPVTNERAAMAPVDEGGFLGISGNPNISPSDTTGAAGPSHVVTAVNIEYAVWPKDQLATPAPATPAPLLSGSLSSLFPNVPGFVFDPKVVYDHYRGRYVLVYLSAQGGPFPGNQLKSRIMIVTIPEATAADPSTWCKRKINGDQGKKDGKQFADYPGLGFDRKYLYITTNQFAFDRGSEVFEYAQITAIGKSKLYGCRGKVNIQSFGGEETREARRRPAFTIQPAITETEAGLGKTEYLVSFQDRSCGSFCGNRMTIWRIKRRKGELDLKKDTVSVPESRTAFLGTQLGGSPQCNPIQTCWDVGDLRVVTAFYDADRGTLYTAHTVRAELGGPDGYTEGAVRWYEFDPSPIKRTRLLRTGLIGEPLKDTGWPSLATDVFGNLFVTYSQAGAPPPGEYLSAYAATVPPGATAPDAVYRLKDGELTYVGSPGRPQRWGDYSATNRDPVDPADVWMVNQYARSDGSPPTTPLWQQTVHRVSFA